MMDILDNELVKKYFTSEYKAYYPCNDKTSQMDAAAWDRCAMAARVLRAMQEEISKGDLVLERFPSNPDHEWQLTKAPQDFDNDMHAAWLRLPDRFQPKASVPEEKKECPCGYVYSCPRCDGPAPEKCPDSFSLGHDRMHCFSCVEPKSSPLSEKGRFAPAVEKKLIDIEDWGVRGVFDRFRFDVELRELVRLARESK